MRLFLAWIKKYILGVKSPSGIPNGFEYEYDMIKAEKRRRQ